MPFINIIPRSDILELRQAENVDNFDKTLGKRLNKRSNKRSNKRLNKRSNKSKSK